MNNNQDEKVKSGSRPGFSIRLNYFLDIAEYPEINKGRITLLAEDEDMSQSGARKWLVDDVPPKWTKLRDMCIRIVNDKLGGKYNPNLIAGWLEYGSEVVPNPFENIQSIERNHIVMSSIYVLVHETAKSLAIDINSMDLEVLDSIYKSLMSDVVTNKLSIPDPEVARSLLILAQRKKPKA